MDRENYPRVTDIIGKQTIEDMRAIPIDVLANAAIRGSKVHEYCTAWLNSHWIPEIDPEYEPWFNAFTQWASENIVECLHSGDRLYDDVKRFTGEFDFIAKTKDGFTVLFDIKTSSVKSKSWPVQLAAYKHLCELNGYQFDKICNIHLKKSYKKPTGSDSHSFPVVVVDALVYDYEDVTQYWNIFASALTCYGYFHHKEKL
jgi:hypothetical protein